jgi:hypothetical protein
VGELVVGKWGRGARRCVKVCVGVVVWLDVAARVGSVDVCGWMCERMGWVA